MINASKGLQAGIAAIVLGTATHLNAPGSVAFPSSPAAILLQRVLPAILITFIFALLAYRIHAVTLGGAVAGSVVSVIIFTFTGPRGFAALAIVFLLTAAATRVGYARKQKLRTAERHRGRRAAQVLANVGVAAAFSVGAALVRHGYWLVVPMVAALCEAAADTVSSECGQAWSDRVYLITNFERVSVGTDGGISVPGTVAGICAAAVVAGLCYNMQLMPRHWAYIAGAAGMLGGFVDSLLGAWFERRRWLTNNLVNLLSTLAAAILSMLFLL